MNTGLLKFLLVIVVMVAAAVYYHYKGPQTEYSSTLFGQAFHAPVIHITPFEDVS